MRFGDEDSWVKADEELQSDTGEKAAEDRLRFMAIVVKE